MMPFDYLLFLPEPQVLSWMHNPYDLTLQEVLKLSTEKCLKLTREGTSALVTDRTVLIIGEGLSLKVISYFTAYTNYHWNNRKQLLLFVPKIEVCSSDRMSVVFEQEQERIEELSWTSYQTYLGKHKLDIQSGLFPDYPLIPYEKTPEYYRKGIIIKNERAIS